MKESTPLSHNANHTAIDLGSLDELMQYSLIHPVNKQEIEGKVFLKDSTHATGTEISFNALPADTAQPYFHIHTKNEETYIILKGEGFFQIDDDCFAIKEGSVIRVAPEGIRGIKNCSNNMMIYLVIQSKENSLEEYSTADGKRVETTTLWD